MVRPRSTALVEPRKAPLSELPMPNNTAQAPLTATPHRLSSRGLATLRALWPAPVFVDAKERGRVVLGAAIGIVLTALLSHFARPWFGGAEASLPWLVAPLGASAVLVFGVPASPLAQPWSVVGGNTVSAMVGIACALTIADPALASAAAVSLAIAAMFSLRCLHPPGGAMALLVVLTHTTHWGFALFPAAFNSLLLVAAGMAYNPLTGRSYPHLPRPPEPEAQAARFSDADLDAALLHYNQVLDVSRDDLADLLAHAEAAAYHRHLGELGRLRCADIMSRDLVTVEYGSALEEAWALLHQRQLKALPVVDRVGRVVGIVTRADFLRHADLHSPRGLAERLRQFITPSGRSHSDRPEVVGQIMTRHVRVASADRHLSELVALFSEAGHHHIPIVAPGGKLVGIITQSDFVRALYRAVQERGTMGAG